MKTVAIMYGFAEGQWHGRTLREALLEHGLQPIKDVRSADVIIAHSGSCYLLPASVQAKTIILVGIPYSPQKLIVKTLGQKFINEAKQHRANNDMAGWLKKTSRNSPYAALQLRKNLRMLRRIQRASLPWHKNIIVVHNHFDPFASQKDLIELTSRKGWGLVNLPGEHDDIWTNPKPYVDLIQSVYEKR